INSQMCQVWGRLNNCFISNHGQQRHVSARVMSWGINQIMLHATAVVCLCVCIPVAADVSGLMLYPQLVQVKGVAAIPEGHPGPAIHSLGAVTCIHPPVINGPLCLSLSLSLSDR